MNRARRSTAGRRAAALLAALVLTGSLAEPAGAATGHLVRPAAAGFDRSVLLRAVGTQEAAVASRAPDRRRGRAATTFYIDAVAGRDGNPGTSPAAAWRTLARADSGGYQGGDRILLRGGQHFAGTLRFGRGNVGLTSPGRRLTIGSYGGGVASVDGGAHDGIRVTDVAGVHVSGLNVVGDGAACRTKSFGILFSASHGAGTLAAGVAIDHVDVHGFCDGIAVGTGDDASRWQNVTITDSASYENGDAGVMTFDPDRRHHDVRRVFIARVRAYANNGTGGIVLFGVDGGTVTHSVAYANGRNTDGAVGIWAFDANRITIEYSESYENLTAGMDGDGFDLDGGVSNSVLQYDYSHGNQGTGFLVCACVTYNYYASQNNVVRGNVSENDGGNGQTSGFYLLGGEPLTNLGVYDNSFYSAAGTGALIRLDGDYRRYTGVSLRNNLLAVTGGKRLLDVADPSDARGLAIQGNDWWASDGRFRALWGTTTLGSLAELRRATGIETLRGMPVGLSVDPDVCALGQGGTVYPAAPATLTAYQPRPGSPLLGGGLDLRARFGVDVGPHNFSLEPLASSGPFDIGADGRDPGDEC